MKRYVGEYCDHKYMIHKKGGDHRPQGCSHYPHSFFTSSSSSPSFSPHLASTVGLVVPQEQITQPLSILRDTTRTIGLVRGSLVLMSSHEMTRTHSTSSGVSGTLLLETTAVFQTCGHIATLTANGRWSRMRNHRLGPSMPKDLVVIPLWRQYPFLATWN